jgi:hypothetical protein
MKSKDTPDVLLAKINDLIKKTRTQLNICSRLDCEYEAGGNSVNAHEASAFFKSFEDNIKLIYKGKPPYIVDHSEEIADDEDDGIGSELGLCGWGE